MVFVDLQTFSLYIFSTSLHVVRRALTGVDLKMPTYFDALP